MTILQILKSKTLLFAVLLAGLSASQALIIQLPLTALEQGVVGLLISVAIAGLRVLTSMPISEK
jgi:hypothetical protein